MVFLELVSQLKMSFRYVGVTKRLLTSCPCKQTRVLYVIEGKYFSKLSDNRSLLQNIIVICVLHPSAKKESIYNIFTSDIIIGMNTLQQFVMDDILRR